MLLARRRDGDHGDAALLAGVARAHELRDARVICGDTGEEAIDIEPRVRAVALLDLGEREPAVRIRLVRHELDDDLELVQREREIPGAERRDAAVEMDLRGGLGVVGARGTDDELGGDDRGDPRLHLVAQ